jgi:hypothetical protein
VSEPNDNGEPTWQEQRYGQSYGPAPDPGEKEKKT